MNINFEGRRSFHISLNLTEAKWLRSQLYDAIDRLFDGKKMAAALMDPDDEDDRKTLQRIYQEPIDFNLALRETLGKYIEVSLMMEANNDGKYTPGM